MTKTISPFGISLPQDTRFGEHCLEALPELLRSAGISKPLLLSDRGLERAGTTARVTNLFARSGIPYAEFYDVLPNPTTAVVDEAVKAFRQSGADAVLALGGGSPMDVAKAVALIAAHGGNIRDYEGAGKIPGALLPLIAIPTTAGTGSEATSCAVITDDERHYKFTILGQELLPHHVFLDPTLLLSLPFSVAAATGMDALIHAIEAYLSKNATVLTDALAEKAMSLIGESLCPFAARRDDIDAAGRMLLGSHFAGLAFSRSRLGNVHAMSHPVSAFFHVPHGVANTILLPTVLRYNALAGTGRYRSIYRCISGTCPSDFHPEMLVSLICRLIKSLELPTTLSQVGVTEDKIPLMAADAMKSGNILVNPRQSTQAEIERLYRLAM